MTKHIHEVIVIGAGVAGLTVAHELQKSGWHDVLVLEAQDYIGGRIKTAVDWGDPVELGAEFVHGRNIATWNYIEQFHAPAVTVGGKPKLIDRVGNEINTHEHAQYMRLNDTVEENGRKGVPVSEISAAFGAALPHRVVELVNDSIGDYEAGDADKLDSGAYSEMCRLTAGDGANHVLPHGYRQLIDFLSSKTRIETVAVVRAVDLTDPDYVAVTLDDHERLFAKRVVVTVPLGVLKSRLITFTPELSAVKQRAINRLGMGRALKYMLLFKTGELVRELFRMADGESASLQTISNWWQSASNHKVLVGFAGGKRHDKIAGMDEDTLLNTVMNDLESMIDRPIRDQLVDSWLVRWDTNPFIRGAYSNHPVGVGLEEHRILAQPIADRLFFAGEATALDGSYATVHGAIASGQRVVKEILARNRAYASVETI